VPGTFDTWRKDDIARPVCVRVSFPGNRNFYWARALVSIIGIIPTICILNVSNRTSVLDYRFIYFTEFNRGTCALASQRDAAKYLFYT